MKKFLIYSWLLIASNIVIYFLGYSLITPIVIWALGWVYIVLDEFGIFKTWIDKYQTWSKKRYWNKLHLDWLKNKLREDARWLSNNPITRAVANRHETMAQNNWYELGFEEISSFRDTVITNIIYEEKQKDKKIKFPLSESGVGYGTHRIVPLDTLACVSAALCRNQLSPNTYAKVKELMAEEGVSFDKDGITLIKPVRGEFNDYHKAEQAKTKSFEYKYYLLDIDALNTILGQLVISAPHSNAKRLIESIARTSGITSRFDETRGMWIYGCFLEDRFKKQDNTDAPMGLLNPGPLPPCE